MGKNHLHPIFGQSIMHTHVFLKKLFASPNLNYH